MLHTRAERVSTVVAAILGKKIGMTRVFDERGRSTPVTVIQAGPCHVLQVKNVDTDGYDAVQIGFDDAKSGRATQPIIGHCAKAGVRPKRFIREIRLSEPADREAGDEVTVSDFSDAEVKWVDVIGISRGFGFQGVMKRHGFKGFPKSHGTERKHRAPGGIGANSGNLGLGRCIKKGKKMAGHMGAVRRTIRNQRLVSVDPDRNVLVIEGCVPGARGGYLLIRQSKTKT
ncbi:MAG: 50S ribosomal protein L3 [Phycisphaerae bacterium]